METNTGTVSSLYQLATTAVFRNYAQLRYSSVNRIDKTQICSVKSKTSFPNNTSTYIYRHGLDLSPENILFDVIHHIHIQDVRK